MPINAFLNQLNSILVSTPHFSQIRRCNVAYLQCGGPDTRHGGAWGDRRYSSYSFLTSALEGGEWSASRPGRALPPEKEPPVPTV
jgi:hypothetical protein